MVPWITQNLIGNTYLLTKSQKGLRKLRLEMTHNSHTEIGTASKWDNSSYFKLERYQMHAEYSRLMHWIVHSQFKQERTVPFKEWGFAWPISSTSTSSWAEVLIRLIGLKKVSNATTTARTYGKKCLKWIYQGVGLVLVHLAAKFM